MKINSIVTILLIILFFSISFSSCAEFIQHLNKQRSEINSRYGSGTVSDAIKGSNDIDKVGSLVPYYTKINKMYDDGIITYDERDRRKNELSKAYDDWKKGYTDHSVYFEKCNRLSKP